MTYVSVNAKSGFVLAIKLTSGRYVCVVDVDDAKVVFVEHDHFKQHPQLYTRIT